MPTSFPLSCFLGVNRLKWHYRDFERSRVREVAYNIPRIYWQPKNIQFCYCPIFALVCIVAKCFTYESRHLVLIIGFGSPLCFLSPASPPPPKISYENALFEHLVGLTRPMPFFVIFQYFARKTEHRTTVAIDKLPVPEALSGFCSPGTSRSLLCTRFRYGTDE